MNNLFRNGLIAFFLVAFGVGCYGDYRSEVPESASREVKRWARKCDKGDPFSCNNLAAAYLEGFGTRPNPIRGFQILMHACDIGADLACRRLAEFHLQGRAGELGEDSETEGVEEAREIYAAGCNGGDLWACAGHARMLADPESDYFDPRRAVSMFRDVCGAGLAIGCVELGRLIEAGQGTERSVTEALESYGEACLAGVMAGCRHEGLLLLSVNTDPTEDFGAVRLLQRACLGDDMVACHELGLLNAAGRFTEQDLEYAEILLSRACTRGAILEACSARERLSDHGPPVDAEPDGPGE